MTKETLDLVIAGLGSQPVAFACFVLARMAQNKGLDVQILEPQDTGCKALAHVRIGQKASRNPIGQGEADVLIGLEPVDALKAVSFLKKDGLAVINGPEKLTNEMLATSFPDMKEPLSLLDGYQVEHQDMKRSDILRDRASLCHNEDILVKQSLCRGEKIWYFDRHFCLLKY